MKIVSGENNLDIVLEKLKRQLVKARKKNYTNAIADKVKPLFYETLFLKTFVFYTNKNALNNSFVDAAYDLLELSIEMGHQSPQMTANKYLHYNLLEILSTH